MRQHQGRTNIAFKPIRLMIVVKSVDAGTGTFVLRLLKIKNFFSKKVRIKTLVLEKSAYRKLSNKKGFIYLHKKKNFYPQFYSLSLFSLWRFCGELHWLKKKIDDFSPDIIIGVDVHCNLLIQLVKLIFLKNKIPTVLTTHTFLYRTIHQKAKYPLTKLITILVRYCYNRADVLIGVSKQTSHNLEKCFNLQKRVHTIYYGIETDSRRKKNKKLTRKGKVIFISVGRLVEQKDFHTLIKAFKQVKAHLPESQLWIVGDGHKRQEIESVIERLDLKQSVVLYGWINDAFNFLQKADVFVLSSNWEGFSWVLLEALSVGLPVISTDTPFGPKEVLADGKYGILVPVGDVARLSDAMLSIVRTPGLHSFYVQKSRERKKFFSLKIMLDSYKTIITELIDV